LNFSSCDTITIKNNTIDGSGKADYGMEFYAGGVPDHRMGVTKMLVDGNTVINHRTSGMVISLSPEFGTISHNTVKGNAIRSIHLYSSDATLIDNTLDIPVYRSGGSQ
jgi:parallel beta-helix repeat protein